ncbi:hypothetical protein BOW53_03525 [Solemya pervernicosa gill symbiont]|uniref:Uncharacterized protein n=1 Tax=Solemya pervernicosa gill symbiont TaxID=642797 RepID=A0A1T2L943_9GAMM|nr:hypothetical protein [Solemya pervernicosa gill symbiont]OOZ41456.1 hypothetical protein BOW53_03525 [Solemya pervernicosa gill symbiont]
MSENQQLEVSPLSQTISSGGRTVNVEIYRFEGESSWVLEVEDEFNNSTVWDDTFENDSAALTEVKKTILAEGIDSLIGPKDGRGEWKNES